MVEWEWSRHTVEPADVLDAAKTIEWRDKRITIDFTTGWTDASCYLAWAVAALQRGGDDAWDSAAGWAKRAVCRRMDGILANNHLGRFLGDNYGRKAEYLEKLRVPGLRLLRDLVIAPRNDIEHAYERASEDHARRAVEVAELFLGATERAAAVPALVALGWNVNYRGLICSKPGEESEEHTFTLTHNHSPWLLIDGHASRPLVFVIKPSDETLLECPRDAFSSAEMLQVNGLLRQRMTDENLVSWQFTPMLMGMLREQLKL